ncbi:MAG: helix-turn-helix domain-containing protein [Deltaproteobacteria bacterium]|nr:helix-turn-helix domain-containing protein [Deltaproteobacteria bacterium]
MKTYKRELLNIKEVAHILKCTEYAIRKWSASGKIHPIKIGRCLRFRQAEIDHILENGLRENKN